MDNYKVLILLGSPKQNGITANLCDFVKAQFHERNVVCKIINIYDLNLAPCQGCLGCRKTGICHIEDALPEVHSEFLSSQLIVLAAPTYFANIPGPVKNLLDRLSGVILDDNAKAKLASGKQCILLTSCATPPILDRLAGQSRGALRAMDEFFKMGNITCKGRVAFSGKKEDGYLPEHIKIKLRRVLA